MEDLRNRSRTKQKKTNHIEQLTTEILHVTQKENVPSARLPELLGVSKRVFRHLPHDVYMVVPAVVGLQIGSMLEYLRRYAAHVCNRRRVKISNAPQRELPPTIDVTKN